MNKEQFLGKLNDSLKKLPAEERQDIIQDFIEHFEIGLLEGKTEEQISAALGNPEQLGKELVANYRVDKVEESASAGNILRAVWAVIGLSFFNFVIVLGPFIAIAGLVFSGWAIAFSFAVSPVLVLAEGLLIPKMFSLFDLFFSISLCGIGLLAALGMYSVTRWLIKGFTRYLKYNLRLVKGGMKNEY